MTSVGAHATYNTINLLKHLDIAGALTMEALNGISCAFDQRVHTNKRTSRTNKNSENYRKMLARSGNTTKQGDIRV